MSPLEWIFIHSPDIPEWAIKKIRRKQTTLEEISDKHNLKYSQILRKMRSYEGDFPNELKEEILQCGDLCNYIRFYTAFTIVRLERARV